MSCTCTQTGSFFFIPSTGNKISYEAVHVHIIGNDGKIIEHRAIRDDLKFMLQLGLVKASSIEYEYGPIIDGLKSHKSGAYHKDLLVSSFAMSSTHFKGIVNDSSEAFNIIWVEILIFFNSSRLGEPTTPHKSSVMAQTTIINPHSKSFI
ncbi:MAG: ester cyclase [Nitrososphaeraceae archaeon]